MASSGPRDAAKHPPMHRAAPTAKNYAASNGNSAEVEALVQTSPTNNAELYHSCFVRSQATHPVPGGLYECAGMFTSRAHTEAQRSPGIWPCVFLLEVQLDSCKNLMMKDPYLKKIKVSWCASLERCRMVFRHPASMGASCSSCW